MNPGGPFVGGLHSKRRFIFPAKHSPLRRAARESVAISVARSIVFPQETHTGRGKGDFLLCISEHIGNSGSSLSADIV